MTSSVPAQGPSGIQAAYIYPKVSIIIPVYNGSNYVNEAIDSALGQTYQNLEVIVVNDGSNDKGLTRKIALSYGDRIKYYEKENGGVGSALNFGIDKMTGEYFSWLSHDDKYLKHKIQTQVEYLRKEPDPNNVVFYGNYDLINEQSKVFATCTWDHEMLVRKPLYGLLRGLIHGCSLLIPRSVFTRFRKFDESLHTTQDYDLWFELIRKIPFKHIPEVLIQSRWHAQQGIKLASAYLPEANSLWIRFQTELSDEEMLACEPTKARFFWELGKHLDTTPYTAARDFAYHLLGNEIDSILVSVIIPFHDRTAMALEAIGSALQQTHRRLEVIAIDDGSTEDTGAIQRLCAGDPRCVYLKQAHQGRAAARNLGLQKASGQYIALLDADGAWERDKVLVQVRAMAASEWTFSHMSYISIDDEGTRQLEPAGQFSGALFPEIITRCPIAASTVMVQADVLRRHPFPAMVRGAEDVAAWIAIAREHPIRGLESALTTIRNHSPRPSLRIRKTQSWLESIMAFVCGDARFDDCAKEKASLALSISNTYRVWLRVDPSTPYAPPQADEVISNVAPGEAGPPPLFEERVAGFLSARIRNAGQFARNHKVIFRVLRPVAKMALRARNILRK